MAAGSVGKLSFNLRVSPGLLWEGIKWALAIGFIGGLFPRHPRGQPAGDRGAAGAVNEARPMGRSAQGNWITGPDTGSPGGA
jgi:hypothetical protein